MLHIKLPKGKVATACERAGQWYSDVNRAKRADFMRELEAWRKTGHIHVAPPEPPSDRDARKSKEFLGMADACSFSTGDVYVSAALWEEIKGWYDYA